MIFADGSMIDDGSSSSSIQQVGMAKMLQPRTAFNGQQLDRFEITIK